MRRKSRSRSRRRRRRGVRNKGVREGDFNGFYISQIKKLQVLFVLQVATAQTFFPGNSRIYTNYINYINYAN